MNKPSNDRSGVIVKLEDGQRRLVATRAFSPDLEELILHEAPVISAPQHFYPGYRAWLIVRQILEDPAKLRWITGKHFAITPQAWDAQDHSFAQKILSVCGVDPQTTLLAGTINRVILGVRGAFPMHR